MTASKVPGADAAAAAVKEIAVKFSHEMSYDASPEEVAAMLADRDFREQVCKAMDSTRHDVSVEGAGTGMKVVVDQTQPARGIPSFAKKFVGDEHPDRAARVVELGRPRRRCCWRSPASPASSTATSGSRSTATAPSRPSRAT